MKLKTLLYPLVFLVLALFAAGCGGGGSSRLPSVDPGRPGDTQWTVLVYMNSDNNLEPYSTLNVNQMEKVPFSNRVKVIVQWDKRGNGTPNGGTNWSNTRRYEITHDTDPNVVHSKLIQDMPEQNMGNPQVLKDFIAWGEQNYPAQHYCLVIWNHGTGWRSLSTSAWAKTRDISYDDTSNSKIRTSDLPGILSSAPHQIDVVAMDACLMQMLEVSYELKGTAGYLVASEALTPGEGYVYNDWLGPLVYNPTMDGATLAKTIAQSFVQDYAGGSEITQSAVNLNKIEGVGTALNTFADTLIPHAVSSSATLRGARENALNYSDTDGYVDLQDYTWRISQALGDPAVTSAYNTLATAIHNAVVYEGHGSSDMSASHGISIWAPDPLLFAEDRARYSTLSLSQETRWDDFLAAQVE